MTSRLHVARRSFTTACLAFLLAAIGQAGNTGKIVGTVTDAQSGEPIPFVNILVVGTQRGASTDDKGKFSIIAVPSGAVSIRASILGYQTVVIKDIEIGADATTPVNIKMTSSAVEINEQVITATKMVNNMVTTGTPTVDAKTISEIPNVKTVEDVLRLQTGVVKQGNNLFLRGGRANEVQYLVDGIPTNSILGNSGSLTTAGTNEELQKVYAGVQSGTIGGGATGLAVSANAIQSVSVQTSGFDADYGNAQSGVINIVTKSGADHYSASAQYRTDRIASTNQNENYSSFTLGGPDPLTKYLMPNLGFKIPGALTFFISADADRSDGPYNYVHNEFYHPLERRIELNGFLGGILNGLGYRFADDQRNAFTFNSKLRYDMSGSDQFSYGYRASLGTNHDYNNFYKYRADSSLLRATLAIQHVFAWTHFFTTNSFVRLYLGKLESHAGNDVAGVKPSDYSSAYQSQDPNLDGFAELGTDQTWVKSLTDVWTTRIDFNSQVHPLHLLKAGFEFNYEEINSTEIQYPTVAHVVNGVTVNPPVDDPRYAHGEYPGYGLYRWNLNNYPNRGGLYVQDNIEFSGLNLHVGARYDYLDIGRQVFYDEFRRDWEIALNGGLNSNDPGYLPAQWVNDVGYDSTVNSSGQTVKVAKGLTDSKRFLYYFTHGYVSPRLSIGYPVTDRIVFYFNYGHFIQFPDRENYYRDPTILGASGNLIGNPSLKPQRTIQYEAGFEDQVSEDMAFTLHAFYKDIFDYADNFARSGNNFPRNFDYASSRGFEVSVNQALGSNFTASVTYSYQLAKGRSSNPLANIFQPQFELPRESRLDWDQNHTANVFATYRVSPREQGKFFGLPFVNNYGISLTWSLGSGFPFTPYQGKVTARNVYLLNNETKPYSSTVNLSMYKGILLTGGLNLLVTLDVTNLFNRRNVNSIYNQTGQPAQFGDADASTGFILPWSQADSRLDPAAFGDQRQIILGMKINWD
ncbi:MAG TPA: TonB-dependent receptor [Bacteroidota bacterium]|jgi:outer membrane receptor protein involved in Fe transport